MPGKPWIAVAGVAAIAALAAAPALADQVFHTSHAAVHAVAGAPLRSGFVNDIHANGNVNAAREEYQLNGAQPGTTYQVRLVIYPSQTCAGSPFLTIPTSLLTTNDAGNGTASFRINNPPYVCRDVNVATAYQTEFVFPTDCTGAVFDR